MNRSEAIKFRRAIEAAAALQDDGAALENIYLYPAWLPGAAVATGERRRYGDTLYRAVQAHTTQAGWTPDMTPALWTAVSLEEWPAWVHPTGAHDAYAKGDRVTHKGAHWISDIDANVWEPGAYGWTQK